MNDRELLELAAKAAGYECKWNPDDPFHLRSMHITPNWQAWNPLDDDGDALRMAITLGISIQHSAKINTEEPSIETFDSESRFDGWIEEVKGKDPLAATRRAIVRAAAEIGKAMK